MSYEKVSHEEVEQVSDAMYFLSEPLGCRQVGVTLSRCPSGWNSKPHDHADDGQEEVYVLVHGTADVRIDGETVPMEDGDAIWISPAATRQIRNGERESTFVLISAPEFESDDVAEESWRLTGFTG